MPTLPSGIYKITNLTSGKVYVGQSQNIYRRRAQHFAALKQGTHENWGLQHDYDENGFDNFRWEVIEFCAINQLNEREHYWIEKLNSYEPNGYNLGWAPYKRKQKKKRVGYKQKHYHKTS